jgi:hypothetical protein
MDEQKHQELINLAKPLNEWLQKNFTPHHQVIIRNDGAEVVQGVIGVPFEVID